MDVSTPDQDTHIDSYGVTDVGLERSNNEDAFQIVDSEGLYVVCDGMGGHASGELASRLAVEAIQTFVCETLKKPDFRWPFNSPAATTMETRVLDSAVRLANQAVFEAAKAEPRHKGMGTTLVALLAGPEQLGGVHVGDSRIYRLRDGAIEQLTDDHSLLNHYIKTRGLTDEQIRTFRGKNVIVRAVGLRESVQPEVHVFDVRAGDILLLCTDGLTDLVNNDLVREQMIVGQTDLKAGTDQLIRAALARGGKDNVTVVMLRVGEIPEGGLVVQSARSSEKHDSSPGFGDTAGNGAWEEETLPSYETTVPPVDNVTNADTPKAMPAVSVAATKASVTAAVSQPIPPPPGAATPPAPPPLPNDPATAIAPPPPPPITGRSKPIPLPPNAGATARAPIPPPPPQSSVRTPLPLPGEVKTTQRAPLALPGGRGSSSPIAASNGSLDSQGIPIPPPPPAQPAQPAPAPTSSASAPIVVPAPGPNAPKARTVIVAPPDKKAGGVDSNGAAIPPPPPASGPSIRVTGSKLGLKRRRQSTTGRSTRVPKSESPFAQTRVDGRSPSAAVVGPAVTQPAPGDDSDDTPPPMPAATSARSTAAETSIATSKPDNSADLSNSGSPPPLPTTTPDNDPTQPPPIPPSNPEIAVSGVPAGDVGNRGGAVGPGLPTVTHAGMPTAPYRTVSADMNLAEESSTFVPPQMSSPASVPAAADLFDMPTLKLKQIPPEAPNSDDEP
ncbi:MAG: serine/threonine-protein phosphatase [Myxococcales bacterium]|nr:serine/threonine-protein phosphatase [Myxococcales bacterium]